MTIELTVTIGDIVVAGTVAGSILAAYQAVKMRLDGMAKAQEEILEKVNDHDEAIGDLQKQQRQDRRDLDRVIARRRSDRPDAETDPF